MNDPAWTSKTHAKALWDPAHLHRRHVLRPGRWTEVRGLSKVRRRMLESRPLDFCLVFFLKQSPERETLKILRPKDLSLYQSLQNIHCCSGKGSLPVGKTLMAGRNSRGRSLTGNSVPGLFIPLWATVDNISSELV